MSKFRMTWRGDEVLSNMQNEVEKALRQVGLDLKQRSQEQAPVDTGDLRSNCAAMFEGGYVAGGKPKVTQDDKGRTYELPRTEEDMTVRVGYALPYALAQHENLQYHHDNGNAKFLESPFEANKQKYKDHIFKAAGKGLRKT